MAIESLLHDALLFTMQRIIPPLIFIVPAVATAFLSIRLLKGLKGDESSIGLARITLYVCPLLVYLLGVGPPLGTWMTAMSRTEVPWVELLRPMAVFVFVFFTAVAVDIVRNVRSKMEALATNMQGHVSQASALATNMATASDGVTKAVGNLKEVSMHFQCGHAAAQTLLDSLWPRDEYRR
jgi:hypothetical protein